MSRAVSLITRAVVGEILRPRMLWNAENVDNLKPGSRSNGVGHTGDVVR
jgi:hypothetical protein